MPSHKKSADSVRVILHASQFPLGLSAELLACVRSGSLNPKFLYGGPEQASRWLQLRAAYAPFMKKGKAFAKYTECFKSLAAALQGRSVHVVGLGCGAAEKEQSLVKSLHRNGCNVRFTGVDVSIPLLVLAQQALARTGCVLEDAICADLVKFRNINKVLGATRRGEQRVFTFFGMLPTLPPPKLLSIFRAFVKPGDRVLVSANLVPDVFETQAKAELLGQYDNVHTRAWLNSFVAHLGFTEDAGKLRFSFREKPHISEIAASFKLSKNRTLQIHDEEVRLKVGYELHLFSSFRYKKSEVPRQFARFGMRFLGSWASEAENESVLGFQKA